MEHVPEPVILIADDDPDDCLLIEEAFKENALEGSFYCVSDGEELLDYLNQRGRFGDPALAPSPSLILLDLNMPRKDGREALGEIKADPDTRRIPVVVLTTSSADSDVTSSYNLGANSYIAKPPTFQGLLSVTAELIRYWLQTVTLPPLEPQA
jgi:CheY-like chemotaxis protein